MAPADKSMNHNQHLSFPSKPPPLINMPNPNPNLYPPPPGNHPQIDKTPNNHPQLPPPPPANYNRNNSSLRLFNDWLDKTTENNKHNPSSSSSSSIPPSLPMEIQELDEDSIFSKSEVLTREQVLKRRSRYLKRLGKMYRDYYWTMMEELKHRHKEFYWDYGTSPFQDDEGGDLVDGKNSVPGGASKDENNNGSVYNNNNKQPVMGFNVNRCEVHGCKVKPMALTRFCFTHILSDPKQVLYKGCGYVTKSSPTGPIYCLKPVLRSAVPLLCSLHLGKAEKHVTKALRKAGHTAISKSKPAPKIHVVLAEFVCHIKRRRHSKAIVEALEMKEDKC